MNGCENRGSLPVLPVHRRRARQFDETAFAQRLRPERRRADRAVETEGKSRNRVGESRRAADGENAGDDVVGAALVVGDAGDASDRRSRA